MPLTTDPSHQIVAKSIRTPADLSKSSASGRIFSSDLLSVVRFRIPEGDAKVEGTAQRHSTEHRFHQDRLIAARAKHGLRWISIRKNRN